MCGAGGYRQRDRKTERQMEVSKQRETGRDRGRKTGLTKKIYILSRNGPVMKWSCYQIIDCDANKEIH